MSERPAPTTADDAYTPFDRLDRRSHRVPELLAVLVAVAGVALQGGRLAPVAGVVLVACWLLLKVEFTFATGVVLLAGVGGDPTSTGNVLALVGLAGLLAVDLWRTWESALPLVLFGALFVLAGGGLVYARDDVALHWLGLGAAAAIAVASYVLHRYEVFRLGRVGDSASEADDTTEDERGHDRRSDYATGIARGER